MSEDQQIYSEEGGADAIPSQVKPEGLSRRVVATIIVAMVVVASGLFVWFEFVGPRSIESLAELVINDPSQGAPGFKHSLAGDKITVKGKVTNITTRTTTVGNLSFIELDDFELIHLVVWGEVPYKVGEKIRKEVRFEWSVCNDESHVYSPQLDFPTLATLPAIGVVLQAVAAVAGTIVTMSSGGSDPITITVFDQFPALSLAGTSLSLRVGQHSFAVEYVEVLGIGAPNVSYGHEVDSISDLASGSSANGIVSFVDSDRDGFLGRNDTFVLTNLTRPEEESGAYTYVLILSLQTPPLGRTVTDLAVAYFVMTSRGALSYVTGEGPYVRIENEVVTQTEVRVTFMSVMGSLKWDDIRLVLFDGSNYAYWYPTSGYLDNGPMSIEDLPSATVGSVSAVCSVVDVAGNGLVDEGDCFSVLTWGGTEFSTNVNYTIAVINEQTMEQMDFSTFHG